MNVIRHGSLLFLFQLVLFPAILLGGSGLLFFLSVPITAYHFPVALAVTVFVSWLYSRGSRFFIWTGEPVEKKRFQRITACFLGVALISLILAQLIPDRRNPGEQLHRGAIQALVSGWNPFRQPFPESRVFSDGISSNNDLRLIDHQPSASRITAAAVIKTTGSMASGRMFHFLYLFAAFLMPFIFLSYFPRIPAASRYILGILTALNPVTLYQLSSFHNDGELASLLCVVITACFHYAMYRDNRMYAILFPALITLGNIKFSGIIYGLSIVCMTWLAVYIMDRKIQFSFIKTVSASLLLALLVVGHQPYVTNTLYTGNPYYRVNQAEAAPDEFVRLFRPVKLVYSLFSRSSADADHMPVLKIPFTLHEDEVAAFRNPEVRYGGFGPYFGSVFLISFAVLIILGRSNRLVILFGLTTAGIILISTLLNPAAWWARQAPQLWMLPLTFMVIFYYTPQHEFIHYLRGFILATLFLNCLMVLRLV